MSTRTRTASRSIAKLSDLKHDPKNARKHNARNIGMIEKSLREVGAARSGVIDEDGVILAGNGTYEALAAAGIEKVKVVEADGNEWVVVRRTGLTPKQKRELSLADNRAAELAVWDDLALENLEIDLRQWFSDEELGMFNVADIEAPQLADGDRAPFRQMTFTVHDEQFAEITAAIDKAKKQGGGESVVNENSNGNALAWVCGAFNRGQS